MAQSYEHAFRNCFILSIIFLLGGALGFYWHSPLIIMAFLLPVLLYEAFRTEGFYTKGASWLLVVIGILEIVAILFHLRIDLASLLGRSEIIFKGYLVPLGDLTLVLPAILAVLSVLLLIRTFGPYTKWLSVIIIIGSFAIIYTINPSIFPSLLKASVDRGLQSVSR